jgi:methyl-accepting chemotaxis protein
MIANSLLSGSALAAADTVVAIPVRDGFDVITAVTGGLIGATFLAVLLAFLFVLSQTRRAARSLERLRKGVSADRGIEHLRNTAANLESISASLRDDIRRLSVSVGDLSERVDQASARMEERIEEFNALMEVIQDEAENVFIDTASTARGVRRGLGRFGDRDGRPSVHRRNPRSGPRQVPEPDPPTPTDDGGSRES